VDKDKAFKIFFNNTCNSGVAYYRMYNFATYMCKEKNVSLAASQFQPMNQQIADWELALGDEKYAQEKKMSREKILEDMDMLMETCDIAVWQVCHTPISFALFNLYIDKYRGKKPILMEVDDNLFSVNPENLGYASFNPNSNNEYFAEMQLRNSNYVIVSTDWLRDGDVASPGLLAYNKHIEVVKNCIDFNLWKNKSETKKDKVRIGWAGGQAHYNDLRILETVMPELLKRYPEVDFAYMGGMPDWMKTSRRVKHLNKWFGIMNYPAELAKYGFDIGLAPLKDNLFNRAKSNLRFLEYSALGIPTVASPVVPFKENKNILFAQEPQEWIDKLSGLIENERLRKNIGKAAYEEVKSKYNVELTAKRYLKILKEIASGKRSINKTIAPLRGNPFVDREKVA
jgi:glycosyltransferase involved in cell wall biosynthesis